MPKIINVIFDLKGFVKSGDFFGLDQCSKGCGVLRVAHPTVNVLQLYANSDICINKRCGLDPHYIEYFASNLNVEIQ